MHDCQRFREDWIGGTVEGLVDCEECRRFCDEVDVILLATAAATQPIPELSEEYWDGFESRLRETLIRENASRSSRVYWKWPALAAAAVLSGVVAWGTIRPAHFIAPHIEIVN